MAVPEIVFHVGLGKVASTYLQHRFFPKLQKIHYIPTNRYRQVPDIIKKGKYGRYFVSREFDQQLEREVSWFASYYPEVKPIIIFRRHDGWAASQYRRYVKNGGHLPFTGFLDVEGDTGLWKVNDFIFYNHIEQLEKHFTHKPLVLFYEELRSDPWAFFDKIAGYADAAYEPKEVSLAKVHTSYKEKELKVMRKMGKYIFGEERSTTKGRTLVGWLRRRGQMLASYAVLYPSKLLPERFVDPAPLIPPEELEKVRDFFAEDWAKVKAYAETSATV
ncbi:MAG: hypothetical protein RIC19_05795 [Phaeodactylibacter sp.]|uniref:hypothetical protein n=1 Tax=Phaeodactylibacter sp. TaxID=1940289 RepID=UPI0032EE9721